MAIETTTFTPDRLAAARILLGDALCTKIIANQWDAVNDLADPHHPDGHSGRVSLRAAALCVEVLSAICDALYPQMNELAERRMEVLTALTEEQKALFIKGGPKPEALKTIVPRDLPHDAMIDRVVELEEKVARLSALLEGRYDDVCLVGVENGEMVLKGSVIEYMANFLAQMLTSNRQGGTPANYAETAITHRKLGELTLTLQRKSGKTPHQLRREVEMELDALRKSLKD